MAEKVKVTTDFDGEIKKLEADLFIGIGATKTEDGSNMHVNVFLIGGGCTLSEIGELVGSAVIDVVEKIGVKSLIQNFMLNDIIEALTKANDEIRSKIPGDIIKDFTNGK